MRKVSAVVLVGMLMVATGALSIFVFRGQRHEPSSVYDRAVLDIGNQQIVVEIARTPDAWAKGLSNRPTLAKDAGMLFIFPTAEPRAFWMKDTRIPLDLIWIREQQVIGVRESVQPEPGVPDDELRRYVSPGPVDWVLEVNAGWAAKSGVTVGDAVHLAPNTYRSEFTRGGE